MTRESSARYSLIWASQPRCPSCTPPARHLDAATPSPTYPPDPRPDRAAVLRPRCTPPSSPPELRSNSSPGHGLPRSAGASDFHEGRGGVGMLRPAGLLADGEGALVERLRLRVVAHGPV